MLSLHMAEQPSSPFAELPDTEEWLQRINRASVVSNVEQQLLDLSLARQIRQALDTLREQAKTNPDYVHCNLYIEFEPKLLALTGAQASVLHLGRSSQDVLATANSGMNRERVVTLVQIINDLIGELLELAKREKESVVPAYTNGVQAQPTLYSHYVLAHAHVFVRDVKRLQECYARFSQCPMGSGVCNGTGWPLDTTRMAELLGYDATFDNAFDAGQCQGNDFPLELAHIIVSLMLHVNQFLSDFMVQYAQCRPWIRYGSQQGVYISSAMPQKRNPGIINDCRRDAGLVIGSAFGVMQRMQNLNLGMPDVRDNHTMLGLFQDAGQVILMFARIIRSLAVDKVRALEELQQDWTCSQELADTLVREATVDFRTAHQFASRLVTWARESAQTPETVTYENVVAVWETWAQDKAVPKTFPLSQEGFRRALNPWTILQQRQTHGSASPSLLPEQFQELELILSQMKDWVGKTLQFQSQIWSNLDYAIDQL